MIQDEVLAEIAALCRKYSQPPVPGKEIIWGGQSAAEASIIVARIEVNVLSSRFRLPSHMTYPGLAKYLRDHDLCNIKFIERSTLVKMLIDGMPAFITSIYKERFERIQRREFAEIVDLGKMLEREFGSS